MNADAGRRPDLEGLKIDDRLRAGAHHRRLRWWWLALPLALFLAVAAGLKAAGRAAEVQVATPRVVQGSGQATLLNASGYITPRRRATVAAKITGRVEEIFAEEGMRVAAGEVLARLDPAEALVQREAARRDAAAARSALAELEINWEEARREKRRLDELFKAGFCSRQEAERAATLVDSFQARIDLGREQTRASEARVGVAEQELENCTVRAPFAGIVVSKDAQRGEMVSPISAGGGYTRTGIATLVDMESLEIEVDVNESYIARVASGQPVEAVLDAYPDWKIPCRVRTVIPTADRQKATVKVRIGFLKLDPRLLPDMGVKVAFLGPRETAAGPAVVVPRPALRQEDGKRVVFLFREGRLERRAVTTGSDRDEGVEVTAGLAGTDQVVVAGPETLRDGQKARLKR